MASAFLARRLSAASACVLLAASCAPRPAPPQVEWLFAPTPAAVGTPLHVRVTIRAAGAPAHAGRSVRVEAHMSHPGMTPIVFDLREDARSYTGSVTLTMAGEWTMVLDGRLPDGTRVTAHTTLTAR